MKLLLTLTVGIFLAGTAKCEESCTWNPDGTKVCSEEFSDAVRHSIWKDPDISELSEDLKERLSDSRQEITSSPIDELETEILVQFFGYLKEWNPTDETLSDYNIETLISAVLNTFSIFDINDDGVLDYDEVETTLASQRDEAVLSNIRESFESLDKGEMTIFQSFDTFEKLGDGKIMTSLLTPFKKLARLPPASAKKIMQGSIQMFLDSDQDNDGTLNNGEFSKGMRSAQEKRSGEIPELPEEQLNALFDIIDGNKDGELTYSEFQATIPEPPKSMDESMKDIFMQVDIDGDGFLSEEEFGTHMKNKANLMKDKIPAPSESDIMEGFTKLDTNDDGKLSPEEMRGIVDEMKTIHKKRMTEAFNTFDKDGDGFLSLDELAEIAKGMEESTSGGQKIDVKMFMGILDQDKDDQVSMDEMEVVLRKLMTMTMQ